MPPSHLILCHPLLLLPSIPPSIRVFSNESALRMRWPKYWSFSFSIIPSKEHPGLISFRMDWLDLPGVVNDTCPQAWHLYWIPTTNSRRDRFSRSTFQLRNFTHSMYKRKNVKSQGIRAARTQHLSLHECKEHSKEESPAASQVGLHQTLCTHFMLGRNKTEGFLLAHS